jgi:Fe-S-cluster containining protein
MSEQQGAVRDRYHQRIDPRVRCDECEAVCCRLTVVLMPEDRVPGWLVHEDERGLRTLAKGDDGWCAAVDRGDFRCGIYADRPAICRKFAMGSPGCRHEREQWMAQRILPTPLRVNPE